MSKDRDNRNPDGRGERPTDPNELARWIVEQTERDSEEETREPDQQQESSRPRADRG